MKKIFVLMVGLILSVSIIATTISCGSKKSSPTSPGGSSGIAVLYIYGSDTAAAGNFQSLLNANGYDVTSMTLANAVNATLSDYSVILISDDSSTGAWGNATLVTHITSSNKPVVGLGEGGSYFFNVAGATAIGQINSGTTSTAAVSAVSTTDSLWSNPNVISTSGSVSLYTSASSEWGPYYTALPGGETLLEAQAADSSVPSPNHYYSLARYYTGSAVYFDWGFRTDPSGMTTTGKDLFLNVMKTVQIKSEQLINYPETGASGNLISDGLDIVTYPGTSLTSIVLWISAGTAGTCTYSLEADDSCFGGTLIGTATSGPVTQDGNSSHNLAVTFTYAGNPTVTKGDAVALSLSQASGAILTNYFSITGNYGTLTGTAIGVDDLNDRTPCLSTLRNYGYSILVYGNP